MNESTITVISHPATIEAKLTSNLEKTMDNIGMLVENRAAKNIKETQAKSPWRKTGQISSFVTHQVSIDNNKIMVEIGIPEGEETDKGTSVAKVGKYLELGHPQNPGQYVAAIGKRLVASDVPPYPWLFPALESNRQNIINMLKDSGK